MTHALSGPARLRRGPGLFADGNRTQRLALAAVPHVLFVLAALASTSTVGFRSVIAVGLALGAVAMAALAPNQLLITLMIWLPLLGLFRRILSWSTDSVGADPLLLVAPVGLGALAIVAVERGALRDRTPLAHGVLALCVLAVLSVANPSQGGLLAGLGGLIFFLVPMLAFWVGRTLVDDRMLLRIMNVIAAFALVAAGYGLWQVYVEFHPWDQRWIEEAGYTALYVGDRIRPFSMFASSAEYAFYCALGLIVWWARGGRLVRAPATLTAAGVLATAVFLQGSRGIIVLLVVSLGVMAAARAGIGAATALLVAAALVFGLQAAVSTYGGRALDSSAGSESESLVDHQVKGLSDPFDPQSSTLLLHMSMVQNGVKEAFRTPIGHGVGSVTAAGSQFGTTGGSTEADPSNAAVSLGLPGLLAYSAVAGFGLRTVYTVARRRRDVLGLVAVGATFVMLLQWLNGGMYAVALLPWLVMGWADRQGADPSTRWTGAPAPDRHQRRGVPRAH